MPSRIELAAKILTNYEYKNFLINSQSIFDDTLADMAVLLGVPVTITSIFSTKSKDYSTISYSKEPDNAKNTMPNIDYQIISISNPHLISRKRFQKFFSDKFNEYKTNKKVISISIVTSTSGHFATLSVVPAQSKGGKPTLVFHDSLADEKMGMDSFDKITESLDFNEDFKNELKKKYTILSCKKPEQIEEESNKNSCWLRSITRALTISKKLPKNSYDIFRDTLPPKHSDIIDFANQISVSNKSNTTLPPAPKPELTIQNSAPTTTYTYPKIRLLKTLNDTEIKLNNMNNLFKKTGKVMVYILSKEKYKEYTQLKSIEDRKKFLQINSKKTFKADEEHLRHLIATKHRYNELSSRLKHKTDFGSQEDNTKLKEKKVKCLKALESAEDKELLKNFINKRLEKLKTSEPQNTKNREKKVLAYKSILGRDF